MQTATTGHIVQHRNRFPEVAASPLDLLNTQRGKVTADLIYSLTKSKSLKEDDFKDPFQSTHYLKNPIQLASVPERCILICKHRLGCKWEWH